MLDIVRDIDSLSNFKRDTSKFVKRMKKSGSPVVLTVNGKAQIVVQDAESYQKMLELLDRAEAIEGIRQGLEDVNQKKTASLEQFDKKMRTKHGLSNE
ncbi:MAG: type II toxin-antitoxin system Phd/YefM family antitoxin [Pyrinomonadaceae bacterium]